MNCNDYLKKLQEDPSSVDPEMDEHVQLCDSCRERRDAQRSFDERIRASLKMDIDPRVTSKIRALPEQQIRRRRAWLKPALGTAAAGVVAVALIWTWLGSVPEEITIVDDLHVLAVDHIDAEANLLGNQQEVRPGLVAELLNDLGGVLTRDIPGVVFAAPCLIREHPGLHLVVRKNGLAVSILMMPGEYMASQQKIVSDHYAGMVAPTDYGSVAIVGNDIDAVEAIVRRVRESVMWGS